MSFFDADSKTKIVCCVKNESEATLRFWVSSESYVNKIMSSEFFEWQDVGSGFEIVLMQGPEWNIHIDKSNNVSFTYQPVFKEMISDVFIKKSKTFDFNKYNKMRRTLPFTEDEIRNSVTYSLLSELVVNLEIKYENDSIIVRYNGKQFIFQLFIVSEQYFKKQKHLQILQQT
jgi:hypothetical protein